MVKSPLNERKNANTDSSGLRLNIEISRKALLVLLVVLIVPYFVAAGFYLARHDWHNLLGSRTVAGGSDGGTPCNAGPWGKMEFIPIKIETPEEFLSIQAFESTDSRWFFGGMNRETAIALMDRAGITAAEHSQLANSKWDTAGSGIYVTAPTETIVSLRPNVRAAIYKSLGQWPENSSQQDVFFFPSDDMKTFFDKSGVSDETIGLVKQLCFPHGKLQFFADLPLVMRKLQTYDDKRRLAKAVSRRSTLLLKLAIDDKSNVDELLKYWAHAGTEKDLRPLFESLTKVPGGTRISLINLLPPAPSARLYTFAFPSMEPLEHDNCHWTSFNFFKDPPDNAFTNAAVVRKTLETDYYPVFTDARYGDLVFVSKANGEIIHSSVFIADNIVYTKNGGHYLSPWMLMRIPEMVDAFSAMYPPEEQLKVTYYRNKYY
ncbi:MAG: hypothetical protein JWO95_3140 [Verrucomicrobiales bacterium]|nr:hypothetical protein [Verrucomicrobiales bacterium]